MNKSDFYYVVMDTCALMSILEGRHCSLKHIFQIKNCLIIVPQHVHAELDRIGKQEPNEYYKKWQQGASSASGGKEKERKQDLAKKIAAEVATYLPGHLQRARESFSRCPTIIEPRKLFLTAKDRAEKIVLDTAQPNLEADNRILEFAKSVVETVGDNGKVLFVTNDNILFSLACYQLGDTSLVCRSNDWEKIVRNAQRPQPISTTYSDVPVSASPVGFVQPPAVAGGSDGSDAVSTSDATPASNESLPPQNAPPPINAPPPKNATTRTAAPPTYEIHLPSSTISKREEKKQTLLQEHISILKKVSEEQIDQQLQFWETKNIPFEDRQMAAYYVYRGRREGDYCTRFNGPLDYCNHEVTTGEECKFIHKCLFCGEKGHGWSNYNKCAKYRALDAEMESPYISTDELWRRVREEYDAYSHDHIHYEALPPNGPASCPPAVAESLAMAVGATPYAEVAATKAPPTPSKRFTLKMNSFPNTKQHVVALFNSEKLTSEKREELKPLIQYIFRLALGLKPDEPFAPLTNSPIPRFLNSIHSLTGQTNHSCLFCGCLHGHGWQNCEAGIKLDAVINELAFDFSNCDIPDRGMPAREVLEKFIFICAKPTSTLGSDKTEKMLVRLAGASADEVRKLEDLWAKQKLHFPPSFKTYLAASFVTAPNKHATKHPCLYHNLSECDNGDKCTFAHQCTHCGSKSHGWTRCPDHLEFCLDMKRLGFTDEKIGEHIVSLQKPKTTNNKK